MTLNQAVTCWICLIAFCWVGPLEGDEVGWGVFVGLQAAGKHNTPSAIGSSQNRQGETTVHPPRLNSSKDLTVDNGAPPSRGYSGCVLTAVAALSIQVAGTPCNDRAASSLFDEPSPAFTFRSSIVLLI